jgi:hypothetical protein
MKSRLKVIFAGTTLAGAAIAVVALAPTPVDRSLDASRIMDSLSRPQLETDKPPAAAMGFIGRTPDLDTSQIRLVGHSDTLTYFAAPTGGDKICLFPVTASGETEWSGCTLLKGFESYGLRLETADRTESGWLVVPAAAEKSLGSVENEHGWSEQAPNFLVRNNH